MISAARPSEHHDPLSSADPSSSEDEDPDTLSPPTTSNPTNLAKPDTAGSVPSLLESQQQASVMFGLLSQMWLYQQQQQERERAAEEEKQSVTSAAAERQVNIRLICIYRFYRTLPIPYQ